GGTAGADAAAGGASVDAPGEDGARPAPDAPADAAADAPAREASREEECEAVHREYAAALANAKRCNVNMNHTPCAARVGRGLGCAGGCSTFADHGINDDPTQLRYATTCPTPIDCVGVMCKGGIPT